MKGGGGAAYTRRLSWCCTIFTLSEKQLFFPQDGQEGGKTGREQFGSHWNVLSASICSLGFVLLTSFCSFKGCVLLLILFYMHACVWNLAACMCCSLDSCVCLSEWVILNSIESVFPVSSSSEMQSFCSHLLKGNEKASGDGKLPKQTRKPHCCLGWGVGRWQQLFCLVLWQKDLKPGVENS